MGYNTWDDFRCTDLTAENIKKVAAAMVENGLDQVGYKYVNVDDCWAVSRRKDGTIVEDPRTFPDGMGAVVDAVHAHGLKFGIYTDRGTATCEGRPGSQGFEEQDAQTYAKWGVDYLKEDSCNAPGDHATAVQQYAAMRDALNRTGRAVFFALCGWMDWYAPFGKGLANSWRVGYDINTWDDAWSRAVTVDEGLAQYAGPGGFNDMDALIGSTPGSVDVFTPTQSRTQFSLWAILASPLIIGTNMLHLSAFDLETYTNREVIAVNQDVLGLQGVVVWQNCPLGEHVHDKILRAPRLRRERGVAPPGSTDAGVASVPGCQQIWAKVLSDGVALAFVNFTASSVSGQGQPAASAGAAAADAPRRGGGRLLPARDGAPDELEFDVGAGLGWMAAEVRDVWEHKNLGTHRTVRVSLSSGDAASKVFLLTKADDMVFA